MSPLIGVSSLPVNSYELIMGVDSLPSIAEKIKLSSHQGGSGKNSQSRGTLSKNMGFGLKKK